MKISEFFKWWYTGEHGIYMTLMGCSKEDTIVVICILLSCVGVIIQYSDISIRHFINARKYPSTKLSKYFLGITEVFTFCLLAGYGYRILSIWVNPYKLLVLLLICLNIVTYRFRQSNKGLNVFHRIHELETQFGDLKNSVAKKAASLTIDLFFSTGKGIQFIPFTSLNKIQYDIPFDSDGNHVITNIRKNIGMPCFVAESIICANGYIPPHQHDGDKLLTCIKGAFFDNKTGSWYKEGETLYIPKVDKSNLSKNWHDIKASNVETHVKTIVFPPFD